MMPERDQTPDILGIVGYYCGGIIAARVAQCYLCTKHMGPVPSNLRLVSWTLCVLYALLHVRGSPTGQVGKW